MQQLPTLSICVPAYNRPEELRVLLANLAPQATDGIEIIVSDDCSPRQKEIHAAVREAEDNSPSATIRYVSNTTNLGYDGNVRAVIEQASGDYCLIMGDDDVLSPDAVQTVRIVTAQPKVGVILRAWKSVDKLTGTELQQHRYFRCDRTFSPGPKTTTAFFRRCIFISGLTIRKDLARHYATDRFDGTLLYQLYLVGRILADHRGHYISDIIALRRVGGTHFFGTSESERDKFSPGGLEPEHSLNFVKGFLQIAQALSVEVEPSLYDAITKELAYYSYPLLALHAGDRLAFKGYAKALGDLGLDRYLPFHVYRWALRALGPDFLNQAVVLAKRAIPATPEFGRGR